MLTRVAYRTQFHSFELCSVYRLLFITRNFYSNMKSVPVWLFFVAILVAKNPYNLILLYSLTNLFNILFRKKNCPLVGISPVHWGLDRYEISMIALRILLEFRGI